MKKYQRKDVLSWVVLFFLSLVWGSSFILIKKGLDVFSPQQVGLLRLGISGLMFLPMLLLIARRIPRNTLIPLLIVGVAGSGIPAFLFPLAQSEISSSLAGILNSLTPLFTLIIGIVFFSTPFKWGKLLGVLIGLSGATFLIIQTGRTSIGGNPLYAILAVLATVSYGISSNTVKKHLQEMPSLHISAISFAMVGIPASAILFTTDFLSVLNTAPNAWTAFGAVAILAIIGTVAASILFFKLVQMTTAVFATTVAYLIPSVALLWGVIDGELINYVHLIGLLLILSGIYILRN